MSRNYYSETNLHIGWQTKGSVPLLTPNIEPLAHRFLKKRIIDTPGAFFHEIGGTETHVHIVVTGPPTLLISDFIGKLKGGTSHDVNQAPAGTRRCWNGRMVMVWFHLGRAICRG